MSVETTTSAETAGEILVVLAHPALERSRANRVLMRAAQAAPGVALRDLYELYPDFSIDVAAEKSGYSS